jgi:flavin reductase (DIM6/NTAB) family NADH-FMN oxidoreductase RutF
MITVDDLRAHPLEQVHRLIEPGPVVLIGTRRHGTPNVMTNGFNMMVRHAPPLIACTVGPWDHSYAALVETGECVVSVPTAAMAATVVDIGNCSGAEVDKFQKFGLTAVEGEKVQAPLVAECYANIECRVADTGLAAAHHLFLLEAVRAWTDPSQSSPQLLHHRGDGTFTTDGPVIDLKARMTKWQSLL